MQRKLTPKKAAALALAQNVEEQRRKLVDEFATLTAELMPVKAKVRRLDVLSKLIRSWYADYDPEQSLTAAGNDYEVILGPAGMETIIEANEAIYKSIGHDAFVRACSFTLKRLTEHVDPTLVLSLTHKERIGARTLTTRSRATRAA